MGESIIPRRKVRIISAASVAGHEEAEGPLGGNFDFTADKEDKFGMDTWEKAESEMQRLAVERAMMKAHINNGDVSFMMAGDLLNQCAGSNYGLGSFSIPYLGLYGACSTASEGILLSTILCSEDNG